MPTYEYVCRDCEAPLEVYQSIHEPALTECPTCAGSLRKVFGNVGVVFKGSGFYRTDNRSKSKASAASRSDGSKADGARSDGARSDGAAKSDGAKSEGAKAEAGKGDARATSDAAKSSPAKAAKSGSTTAA